MASWGGQAQFAPKTCGEAVGCQQLVDGCPPIAVTAVIVATAYLAEGNFGIRPHATERKPDPDFLAVQRDLARDGRSGFVRANVEAALV